MISHEKRLLFIHVPKTGGTAVTYTYLDRFEVPGPGVDTHRRVEDFDIDPTEYYKFAVVRNPWETCMSWYTWHLRHGDRRKSMEVAVQATPTPRSLGIEGMNEVIRFEDLRDGLDHILVAFGIRPRKLRRMNCSPHGNYREYYTDRLREIVAERFAWEIREYGYEF